MKSVVFVLMIVSILTYGQEEGSDNVNDIIKKVEEKFQSLKSYESKTAVTVKIEPAGLSPDQNMELYLAFKTPDKIKIQNRSNTTETIVLYNGENVIFYLPGKKQYRRETRENFNFKEEIRRFHASSNLRIEQIRDGISNEITEGGKNYIELKFVTPVPEKLFPFPYADSSFQYTTWRVEKERMLLVKTETTTNLFVDQGGEEMHLKIHSTSDVSEVRVNENLEDSIFVLTLPEDAEEFSANQQNNVESELIGKEAKDFKLTDLEGKEHSLSDYKGKVVFLDFWATWCAPCRETMPITDKIYKEFGEKGLIVLAINMSENKEKVESYIKNFNYSFTTLLDTNGKVGGEFNIQAIPSFILIDREGKIISYELGFHGEESLRAKLKEAGIE